MTRRRQTDHQQRSLFTRRALLLAGGQCVAFGLLARRLYQIQIRDGAHYAQLADNNRTSSRLLAPMRAEILDRFGQKLASNSPTWRALIVAEQTEDPAETLDAFAAIVALEPRERQRVERQLARAPDFTPILVRDYLGWNDMAVLEVHAPDLPGIMVDEGQRRIYPLGPVAAHIIGYVAPANQADQQTDPILALPGMRVGRAGLEQQYEPALRGQAGSVSFEVNAIGRVVRELNRQPGHAAAPLQTSLDSVLQKQVTTLLGDRSASAVVLDCRDGGILAMASTPSFDPIRFDEGVDAATWKNWQDDPRAPLTNKAIAGLYPPGSTFKMAVAMAALQAGSMTTQDRINCPGYLDIGDARFHCWKHAGHGWQTVHTAIRNSCDVFFYETARRTGIEPIAAMARMLGLGVKPGTDLPGCHAGLIPDHAWCAAHNHSWTTGDTVITGIGQGFVQASPLQLAAYVASIATGKKISPWLAHNSGASPPLPMALDAALMVVRKAMWSVVNEPGATATTARLPRGDITMAGKTGSAQVERVSRAAREDGNFKSADLPWALRPHALFVCYAPFDAPKFAVSVVVEHGNAGAEVAAPLARDIMMLSLRRSGL